MRTIFVHEMSVFGVGQAKQTWQRNIINKLLIYYGDVVRFSSSCFVVFYFIVAFSNFERILEKGSNCTD